MSTVNEISAHGHERVAVFQDKRLGLTAIIAVHDTTLGPGLGGCRMKRYGSLDEALYDVLRLSEGMTYKNSLAGLDLGGGKSVIIRDNEIEEGREEIFLQFGRYVASFGGDYITAEDIGTRVSDMEIVRRVTEHVTGRDPEKGGAGDPSPYTARGVFEGIRACLERRFGSSDPRGKTVAIQGVGSVGTYLARLLAEAGAKLIVADIRPETIEALRAEIDADVAGIDAILESECDVLAPCAVGGIINPKTAGKIRAAIVAGGANNQLSTDDAEELLRERNIIYAPDFALNAGGVICCAEDLAEGGVNEARILERVGRIYHTVGSILDEAKRSGELAGQVAIRLARERIERAAAARR